MAGVKPLLETIGALLPKGIKAWHASPHDFDKVDLSKIGTGQGAASYGPGFYAAESPKVSGLGGEYWNEFLRHPEIGGTERVAATTLKAHDFDREKAIASTLSYIDQIKKAAGGKPLEEGYAKIVRDSEKQIELLRSGGKVGPRVYELNLKADPRSFLQWDEPLAQQPNITKQLPMLLDAAKDEAYNRALSATSKPRQDQLYDMVKNPEQATGEFAYRQLAERMRGKEYSEKGPERVMRTFDMAGIPGVRYLDQHSRALGPANDPAAQKQLADVTNAVERLRSLGDNLKASELDQTRARLQRGLDTPRTYNYVVNNPEIIEIMRKLAIPGMLTGGAASVYQPQGQQ